MDPTQNNIEEVFDGHHPLLNPMIVSKVVEHLNPDFESFRQLRLVCNVWKDATLHRWRNTAVIKLVPDVENFSENIYDGLSFSAFMQEKKNPFPLYKSIEIPFKKFKLKGFILDLKACLESNGQASEFWNKFGPQMKYLHFENCKFSKCNTNALIELLDKKTPNLKHLSLTQVKVVIRWRKGQLEASLDNTRIHLNITSVTLNGLNKMRLQDLLMFAPNLKEITCTDLGSSVKGIENLGRFTLHDRFSKYLLNLRKLDLLQSSAFYHYSAGIHFGIFPRSLMLEDLSLNLKPLVWSRFRNPMSREWDGNVESLLLTLSRTLKQLTIFRPPICEPFENFMYTQDWCKLHKLHLFGAVARSFDFLKHTPNLVELDIDMECFPYRQMIIDTLRDISPMNSFFYQKYRDDMVEKVSTLSLLGGLICPSLESLAIDYEFSVKSLKALGKWMPNLKRLKTILNPETIKVASKQWQNLTDLTCLYGSRLCQKCFYNTKVTLCCSNEAKIANFKKLQHFEYFAHCNESPITDETCFDGLLKLSTLHTVLLSVNPKMSIVARQLLEDNIANCKLIEHCPDGKFEEVDDTLCCTRCNFRSEASSGFWKWSQPIIKDEESMSSEHWSTDEETDAVWH